MSKVQGKVWRNTKPHLLINTEQMKMILNTSDVLGLSNIHLCKSLLLRISLHQEKFKRKGV